MLTNVEIYKAVGPAKCIKGIQRIRDMWRIYMDNTEDRITLIVEGGYPFTHKILGILKDFDLIPFALKFKISLFPLMTAKFTVL